MEPARATRIGVIGGAGWLGGAIAAAILKAGITTPENLALSYRSKKPDRFGSAFWTTDNQALADCSDIIIVSIRPEDWPPLCVDAKGKLVISVMAGIRLFDLCRHHRTQRAVRSLPNGAAEVSKSYTPWTATAEVDDEERALVRAIFDACGQQDEVPTESEIDYFTGLTGSGPAFPALLAQAMMTHALAKGLDRNVARRAVNTVLVGAGSLLELRDECPFDTVQTFRNYQGTTAAAIETMVTAGFSEAVAKGLTAAFEKSVEMGETT